MQSIDIFQVLFILITMISLVLSTIVFAPLEMTLCHQADCLLLRQIAPFQHLADHLKSNVAVARCATSRDCIG